MSIGKPNLKVVEILPKDASFYNSAADLVNDLAELIKNQKVYAIGMVCLYEDGSIGTAWSKGTGNNVFKFLGAIEHLKQRYYREEFE